MYENEKLRKQIGTMANCIKETYYLMGIILPDTTHSSLKDEMTTQRSIILHYCYLKYAIGKAEEHIWYRGSLNVVVYYLLKSLQNTP